MKMFTLSFLLVTHFSSLSFAGNSSFEGYGVYNIVLKSFQAVADGKSAKLTWELGDMDHEVTCALERSEDGIRFNAIETYTIKEGFRGTMRAVDKLQKAGQYYYRLTITKPGFIPYVSGIVTVRINADVETTTNTATTGYQVMNPFRHQLTIKGKFSNKPLRVEISDMNGRVRMVKTIEGSANNDRISLFTGNLDKGAYILRVKEDNAAGQTLLMTRRIIKND